MPEDARIPALLDAYDKYKSISLTCAPSNDPEKHFESSCYSILISTILKSKIKPNTSQATAILRRSFHRCGHGDDVEPPLEMAEAAFRNQPYTKELFDAVIAYHETLRPLRSSQAWNVKRKLGWVLWHDPRYKGKSCYTRQIQDDIHSMKKAEAFKWQWLLRNTTAAMGPKPGERWVKEARVRLTPVGAEEFHQKLDQWFTVDDEEPPLSATGSCVLRLLIWYAMLDAYRNLPIVRRLEDVCWKDDASKKVDEALWSTRSFGRE